jgi:hypothetical protein
MTTTFSCDPGWVLNGENCFWQGIMSDRGADFTETMSRNCGANMDFADPARCKPRIRRATAVQNYNPPPPPPSDPPPQPENSTQCINVPDTTYNPYTNRCVKNSYCMGSHVQTSYPGSSICDPTSGPPYIPPPPPSEPPPPKTQCSDLPDTTRNPYTNRCVSNSYCASKGGVQTSSPGTSICNDNAPPPKPPTPPPTTCMEGFHLGADGKTCEKTDLNNNCPPNTYFSAGSCIPIPGGGLAFDNSYGGYNRLSANYQTASSYGDVFSTPENDTKPAAASGLTTNTILIGLAAVAGIGGIYYMSTTNVRRRYF